MWRSGSRWARWSLLLVVVLAGLMASAAPGVGQAPPPPAADLAVADVRLTKPVPTWTFGSTDDSEVEVVITNKGSAPTGYRIDYLWVNATVESPLNGDSEASFDVSDRGPIQPGQSRTHAARWTVQEGQVGPGTVRVRVTVVGGPADPHPADNAGDLPLFLPDRRFDVAAPGGPVAIRPGGHAFQRVDVLNAGNVPLEVGLVARPATGSTPDRVAASLAPSSLTVAAHATATATLFLEAPFTGDLSAFEVRFEVVADAQLGSTRNATLPPITNATDGPPGATGFTMTPSRTDAWLGAPGAWAQRTWHLSNTGTVDDVYDVALTVPADWNASVLPSALGLHPGETRDVTIAWQPPADQPSGSSTTLTLVTRSRQASSESVIDVTAMMHGPALRIVSVDVADVYVGDAPVVEVAAGNPGDDASSEEATIHVALSLSDGTTFEVEVPLGSLAAGGSDVVAVPLATAEVAGPAFLEVEVLTPEGTESSWSRNVDVRRPVLSVVAPSGLSGIPGQAVHYAAAPYAFLVENLGTSVERVSVVVAAHAGHASVQPESFDLPPGGNRSVAVTHTLPIPSGDLQDSNLTVTAFVSTRPSFAADAKATTGIVDEQPPRLEWRPPAVWSADDAMPVRVAADDASRVVNVTLRVTPAVGQDHRVNLTRQSDAWTGTVAWHAAGDYELRVASFDAWDNVAGLGPFLIQVRPVARPTIDFVDLPGDGPLAADGAVLVRISDALGVASVEVRANGESVSINATMGPEVSIPASALPVGLVRLDVVVTNVAGASSEANATFDVEAAASGPLETPGYAETPASPGPGFVALVGLLWILAWRARAARLNA